MEIKREGNIITIYGNIKSIEDFEKIKFEVDEIIKNNKSITIYIPESISLTSSVIGYLNKLVESGITVNMKVNEDLYELLDELNLIKKLKVRKL